MCELYLVCVAGVSGDRAAMILLPLSMSNINAQHVTRMK